METLKAIMDVLPLVCTVLIAVSVSQTAQYTGKILEHLYDIKLMMKES